MRKLRAALSSSADDTLPPFRTASDARLCSRTARNAADEFAPGARPPACTPSNLRSTGGKASIFPSVIPLRLCSE
jgi:hypothetical protein